MSDLYDPAYLMYLGWGDAFNTLKEGYVSKEPLGPFHPLPSSPEYSPPPPSDTLSSLTSVSPSAYEGLDWLEDIPETSHTAPEPPVEIAEPPLARDPIPLHLREPSTETDVVQDSPTRGKFKRYRAPKDEEEEIEMLDSVKRVEKKMKLLRTHPVGVTVTHDDHWLMELGKITRMEKENVYDVVSHDRVEIGDKKVIVFTCLTHIGEFSFQRGYIIKMLATEMSEKKFPNAWKHKKEYYYKLKQQGKRI
jgi:hypothetical protein